MEVAQLAEWCGTNNLSLNVEKTKEVVMNFRRNSVDHPPLTIDSSTVERVSSTKFLGVHITEDLTWKKGTTVPTLSFFFFLLNIFIYLFIFLIFFFLFFFLY